MSLSFVSTSVLSSTDGVSHNEEKQLQQSSTERSNNIARQDHRPLFEQLRVNADKAQEEYEEVGRAMRGTRMLDEEDVAHLDGVMNMQEARDRDIQEGIENEVARFRTMRAERPLALGIDDANANASGGDGRNDLRDDSGADGNIGSIRNHSTDSPPSRKDVTASTMTVIRAPIFKKRKRRKSTNIGGVILKTKTAAAVPASIATKQAVTGSVDSSSSCGNDLVITARNCGNKCSPSLKAATATNSGGNADSSSNPSTNEIVGDGHSGGGLDGLMGCYGSDDDDTDDDDDE